jgi:hypothetical protein
VLAPSFTDEAEDPKALPEAVPGEQKRKVMYFVSNFAPVACVHSTNQFCRRRGVESPKSRLFCQVCYPLLVSSMGPKMFCGTGFVIHGYLGGRTLATKCVGLALSVASGLSLGTNPFPAVFRGAGYSQHRVAYR